MRIQASEFEAEVRSMFKDIIEVGRQINLRERERNGNIEKLFERQLRHDEWHGHNDERIGERVKVLEEDRAARLHWTNVIAAQWKFFTTALTGAGILGGLYVYFS
jgi:hypothetical protein